MDVLEPMDLHPGDRRILAVLPPGSRLQATVLDVRSCGRCGRRVEPATASVVLHGPPDGGHTDAAAVCGGCAAGLTPFRLIIDLHRLGGAGPSSTGGSLTERVEHVLARRADPPVDALRMRAADTCDLAQRLATTRTHVALRLRDLGVLAGVDVADTVHVDLRGRPGRGCRGRAR